MLAIDTETTGLAIHRGCRAFTISAVCHDHKTYLWKFKVDPFTRKVIYHPDLIQDFKDTLSKHEELIFHHANFDLQVLQALGVSTDYIFDNHDVHDTMVMSHAYKSNNTHGLKELGVTLLSFPEDDETALGDITKAAQKIASKLDWRVANKSMYSELGSKKEIWKTDYWVPEEVAEHLKYPKNHLWRTICDKYAINDVIRTMGIYILFQELMTAKQKIAYHKARKLIQPVLDMQYETVTILPEELDKARITYKSKHSLQLIKLQQIVGNREFNPASPTQLSKILFDTYKFPIKKINDSGNPSTNKEVITTLLRDCPTKGRIPPRFKFLIELKRLKKTKATLQYITNYVNAAVNNHIQPFIRQTGTNTGRFSCSNPNLNNVGKDDMNNPFSAKDIKLEIEDDEESFKLRNVFGPQPGTIWTCIDYKQFQLLIFAVVSKNKQLIEDYINGVDLHEATARQIFDTTDISAQQRTLAKNVNFGILFGAGPAKIDETAGMKGLYKLFCTKLPGAKRYLEEQARIASQKGYVHTLGGYRLYVPRDRAYAASCYVIQGTEAEIVKDAIVDLHQYTYTSSPDPHLLRNSHPLYNNPHLLKTNGTLRIPNLLKSKTKCQYRMLLPVHDEIIFRSNKTNDIHLYNLMRIMEYSGERLGVPVKVDADIVTNNWASKQSYTPQVSS